MSIQSIRKIAESFGYVVDENSDYLGVGYALIVFTDKPPRYCQYAAFDSDGNVVALGSETGGDGMGGYGGWVWIKGSFDNRIEKDLENHPETELLKQLGVCK